jgi:hypothetical protein
LIFIVFRSAIQTEQHDMKIIFVALLLFSLAHAQRRIGVYTSSDCSEESIVGYLWFAATFDTVACGPVDGSSPAQYYDATVVEEMPAPRSDWAYYYEDNLTASPGGCTDWNETTNSVIAVKPDFCLNFVDASGSIQYRSRITARISSCSTDGAQLLLESDSVTCEGTPSFISSTCAVNGSTIQKVTCPPTSPEAPVASPESGTPSASPTTSGPSPSASTPTTSTTPSTAPTAATPLKKTSFASITAQLSLVAVAGIVGASIMM